MFALGTVTSQALHISFEAQLGIYKYATSRICSGNGAPGNDVLERATGTTLSDDISSYMGSADLPKNMTLS